MSSGLLLFSLIVGFILAGIHAGVNIHDAFIEGAREGFPVAVKIIPWLAAIAVFRAAGCMEIIEAALAHACSLPGRSRVTRPGRFYYSPGMGKRAGKERSRAVIAGGQPTGTRRVPAGASEREVAGSRGGEPEPVLPGGGDAAAACRREGRDAACDATADRV